MSDSKFWFTDTKTGEVFVPGFALAKGEFLGIEWPIPQNGKSEQLFITCFKKRYEKQDGNSLNRVQIVDPNKKTKSRLSFGFSKQPQESWNNKCIRLLQEACGIAEVVVFWDSGMDYTGLQQIKRIIFECMERGVSFVYISFPMVPTTADSNFQFWTSDAQDKKMNWIEATEL